MDNLSNAFIEEHKRVELRIDIDEMLKPASECCIYRVPKHLRKINKAAYTPQLVSIGPLHHGNKELAEMEKQKVRYKKEFGERITEEKWEDFITFIKENEQRIRNCYAETSKLSSPKFITMVLYDAIFIIELFLKWKEPENDDFLLNKPYLRAGLKLDLQLLENQLPYFVLNKLYILAKFEGKNYPRYFFVLPRVFLDDSMLSQDFSYRPEVAHFIDLRRNDLLQNHPKEYGGSISDLPSAIKLHESGVKFTGIEGGCLLNIEQEKRNFKIPIPYFSGVELKIPNLQVVDNTESIIRNVMAFEQCHYPSDTHICNYISFMDFLIDTKKDVDLLIDKGIILNLMGDSATIVRMFNRLGDNINLSDSCYCGIVTDLKAHYYNGWNHKRASWNRAKAILKRVYFSNLWKGTGTVAAIILLLLTLIQTICSIKQVV